MLDFPSPLRPFIFQLINENNFRQILRFDNAQGGKKKKIFAGCPGQKQPETVKWSQSTAHFIFFLLKYGPRVPEI